MDLLSLFLIAIGLSMDAFAVSLSNGLAYRGFGRRQAIEAAAAFGLFQALMPVTGYFAGRTFSDAISAFDHWIALGLLAAIGGKMVFDGLHDLRSPKGQIVPRSVTLRILLVQAVATSIDALAIGISFAVMRVNILTAAGFIGVVTLFCCLVGAGIGSRFGRLLGHRAEIFGGIILIGIGLKICFEHTMGV